MRSLKRMFNSAAGVGYAIAGVTLLVLPAFVVYREGGAGVTAALVMSALFGIGFLVAAVLGAKTGGTGAGSTA